MVGVDLGLRSRANRAAQAGARQAVVCAELAAPDVDESADLPGAGVSPARAAPSRSSTELDAEESLAEFRELVSSAGGVVVAEIMQRRARPDPATLIGSGKV